MINLKNNFLEKNFWALGTDISIRIIFNEEVDRLRLKNDLLAVEKIYRRKEKTFSRFDQESELSKLNFNLGNWQKVSADFLELSILALKYHQETAGIFDPRIIEVIETLGYDRDFRQISVGKDADHLEKITGKLDDDLQIDESNCQVCFNQRMDFGGIAKGYITDKVAGFLKEQGWKNFIVDSGGDIYLAGKNQEKRQWKVAIEDFLEEDFFIEVSDGAVATSGISRKKWKSAGKDVHHLIKPFSPSDFSFGLRSVSVLAGSTAEADIWAKVFFLLGKEQGADLARSKKLKAFFLDCRGNLFES